MGRYEFVEDGPRYEFEDSSRATIEDEANKRLVAAGSVMGKSQPVSMFGIEFSKDKPATEIGGNPGAAAIAATLAKWGSNIIPGVDSPELQQNRAMLGENFKDRQEYAGAGFLMDMLPNLTMARLMPNAGYLNQVIQGTLGGQMVGGKEGAMIGAAGSALFGAPQLLGNTAKRVTLEEPWWMRGAGSQTNTATSPKYLAGQADETLLGAPLTVGQKTGNLAIIQKERALLSERLDVSILQDHLLDPLLNIKDVRTDKRIDFVGGIRGTAELEKLVNSGKSAVAFSMFPVSVADLMGIADAGEIMPPKSTWFEPKLRDALLIHTI